MEEKKYPPYMDFDIKDAVNYKNFIQGIDFGIEEPTFMDVVHKAAAMCVAKNIDQEVNLQFKGEKKDMESKSNLQDSGNRREFEGGAVRDICEGKGRCDLLPLNEIVTLLYGVDKDSVLGKTLANIDGFLSTGDHEHLYCAMHEFILYVYGSEPNGILELAVHFEDGAKKYKEWNWQKGIPAHSYLDSAIRHLLKFHRGDTDERHDRAFLWNITCLLWTLNNKHDLDDIHYYFYDNNKAKR